MIVYTLREQSGETSRVADFYEALKSIPDLKIESMQSENWMDEPYDSDYGSADKLSYHESGLDDLNEIYSGPEDEAQDADNWMDDLDEAA
jgi:hypothetical protein